jgi:DNA-binding NarL/FixJ family response regulator
MITRNLSVSRVALFAPCQMTASGIQHLLADEQKNIRLVWSTGSLAKTQRQLALQSVDILIVSFCNQQTDWQQRLMLIRAQQRAYPRMKIIVLLDVYIPYLLQQLSELSISGIISQHDPVLELTRALRLMVQGIDYYSPRIHTALLTQLDERYKLQALCSNEILVLQYLLNGYSVQQTAALIYRRQKTVVALKCRAMRKLGITHSAALVAMKEMLENLYQKRSSATVKSRSSTTSASVFLFTNISMKTPRAWLPILDVVHTKKSMTGHYPIRKE